MKEQQQQQQQQQSMEETRRRSERPKQAVKTKHLRRIRELFWEDDERYESSPEPEDDEDDKEDRKPQSNCADRVIKTFGRLKLQRIHGSPHIYTVENFLTESELAYLRSKIELAEQNNYFKTSFVDFPTTTFAADQDRLKPAKNNEHKEDISNSNHGSRKRPRWEYTPPSPGDCVVVLWTLDNEDISGNKEDDNNNSSQHTSTETANDIKYWGATVNMPSHNDSNTPSAFTITTDTTGISPEDLKLIMNPSSASRTEPIFTLKYDLYPEAGYDQHTYCDVIFLSDRLLYDISSQCMCKYTAIVGSKDCQHYQDISEQLLLSDDEEEQEDHHGAAESNNSTTNSKHKHKHKQEISFQTPQRTSAFIHFSKSHHTKIISIETRAAELLGLPASCIEPIQLVRYQLGEYFRPHHDLGTLYEDGSVELPPSSILFPPRRLVTVFVYLNDVPKEFGGATQFPLLKSAERASSSSHILEVQPKRGMGVLFCNVGKHGSPEPLTVHSGEPLKIPTIHTRSKGAVSEKDIVKYGINIWACER